MSKRPGRNTSPGKTATASTPEGELQRHLAALDLKSVEEYRQWCRTHGFGPALNKAWKERREEIRHAERLRQDRSLLAEMESHLKVLGVDGRDGYIRWCRAKGFAETLRKRAAQRAEELLAYSRDRGAQALSAARQFERRPVDLIRAIASGNVDIESLRPPHLRAIREAFGSIATEPQSREAFERLLVRCSGISALMTVDPAVAHLGPSPGNTYIAGLLALARRHEDWIASPGDWKPDSHNARRQFGTIARKLLCRYDVPVFMDAAWFADDSAAARVKQDWFLHIGGGQNIRTAGVPIALTRRAAHLFLQAPKELPIEAALRWAQTRALGGDEPLARALLATRLAELQEDEPFWQSVIFFFINNPMLDFARIGGIVDYIHHRRFVPSEVLGPDGQPAGFAIPEPNFSMKGRTGIALLRRVEEWHRELAREAKRPPLEWPACGIGGFEWKFRDAASKLDVIWTIEEILSSRVLQEEGREMRHCVASYASTCARGQISIWTLQVQEGAGSARRRVMTIEVQNTRRTITQARGRCNKSPGEKRASPRLSHAPDVVRRWAAQKNLSVPGYLFPK